MYVHVQPSADHTHHCHGNNYSRSAYSKSIPVYMFWNSRTKAALHGADVIQCPHDHGNLIELIYSLKPSQTAKGLSRFTILTLDLVLHCIKFITSIRCYILGKFFLWPDARVQHNPLHCTKHQRTTDATQCKAFALYCEPAGLYSHMFGWSPLSLLFYTLHPWSIGWRWVFSFCRHVTDLITWIFC